MIMQREKPSKINNDCISIEVKIGKNQSTLVSSSKFSRVFITKNNSIKRSFNSTIF